MYALVKSDEPLQAPTAADGPLQTDAFVATAEHPREDASTAPDIGDPATVEGQTENDNLGNDPKYSAGEFDDDDDDSFTDIVAYYLCKRNFIVSAVGNLGFNFKCLRNPLGKNVCF